MLSTFNSEESTFFLKASWRQHINENEDSISNSKELVILAGEYGITVSAVKTAVVIEGKVWCYISKNGDRMYRKKES